MDYSNDTHRKSIGFLLWIFGFTGSHRFYMGKRFTGIIYLLTGGIDGLRYLYDLWTLNDQVSFMDQQRPLGLIAGLQDR